jgi:DNA segregation ATPase FtsK/SpoIIIE-like protein
MESEKVISTPGHNGQREVLAPPKQGTEDAK